MTGEYEDDIAEDEVTRIVSLLGAIRPDLVDKFSAHRETLREQARLALRDVYKPIPDPFRRAFQEPER